MIPVKVLAKKKKKTQTLSFDVLIAVVVFVAAVAFIIYLISQYSGGRANLDALIEDGEVISSQLISPGTEPANDLAIVVKNRLEKEKLAELAALPYEELKAVIGVEGDFCIHFEDEDGNLVDIDERPGWVQFSIGSPNLNLTIVEEPDSATPLERIVPCGAVEMAT